MVEKAIIRTMKDQPGILIADEGHYIRSQLSEFLSSNGFRVKTVEDGAALWEALDTAMDLLVLDVHFLGEGGLAHCWRLREKFGVPIILMSLNASAQERILGLEAGADDYLSKPFDPRELLARIKGMLRSRHALPLPLTTKQA